MGVTREVKNKHMNTASLDIERASGIARYLEDREAERTGATVTQARRSIAGRMKVPAGLLERLRKKKDQIKALPSHYYRSLCLAFEQEVAREIKRLEDELAITRTTRMELSHDEVEETVALIEKAKNRLNRLRGDRA